MTAFRAGVFCGLWIGALLMLLALFFVTEVALAWRGHAARRRLTRELKDDQDRRLKRVLTGSVSR